MNSYASIRRRRYKQLKKKLKAIAGLKLVQIQSEKKLTDKLQLEKINKEKLYRHQLNQMYIKPSDTQQQQTCTKYESDPGDAVIGSYAFLKDLTHHSMYNGKVVKILEYFENTQRWKVRLLPKHTTYFLVLTMNLSPITLKKKKLLNSKLSIQEKHSLLIFGFIHKSTSPDHEVTKLISQYTALPPIIIPMETVDKVHVNFMVDLQSQVSVYDSVKMLKQKMTNIIKKRNIRLDRIHLWFKFGDVKRLYPDSLTSLMEMYEYDRLVSIPCDEEESILLGDVGIVGKLDVKIDCEINT